MNGSRRLLGILDEAIGADEAVLGNIQLLNPQFRTLEIVVQRGFSGPFLDLFRTVRADEPSACGRALESRRRVMIPDIRRDRAYAPYRSIAEQAGYRAVQSTPILLHDEPVGMLSTHFAQPHRLTHRAEKALDRCASEAGLVVAGILGLLGAIAQRPTHV